MGDDQGGSRAQPHEPSGGTLFFAQLSSLCPNNKPFLKIPRKLVEARQGRTHEAFVVITQHNGAPKSGTDNHLWGNVRRVASLMGIVYNDTHEEGHPWSPFVKDVVDAFNVSGTPTFFGCGRALCIGVGSSIEERKRASVLSAVIWSAQDSRDAYKRVMQDASEVRRCIPS